MAVWFGVALVAIVALLIFTAHHYLDYELRLEKWDRTHPEYPENLEPGARAGRPEQPLHGSYSEAEINDILREVLEAWAWVGLPALGLTLIAGFLLANRSIRPVKRINQALTEKTPETLKIGIPVPEKDSVLAELVSQINALLFRVGDAYEEMSAYSSRVAHELRTPLTLLRMRIEKSAAEMPPELSEELQEELARLSRFIERSLLSAKAESGRLEPVDEEVDLSGILEDLRDSYQILLSQGNVVLDWNVEPGLKISSDRDLIRQILHNLLGNACRYSASAIRLHVVQRRTGAVLFLANDYQPETRALGGLGIGLRLVRTLAASLPGHKFAVRDSGRVFAVRLTWKPRNKAKR
jgi:signal transduction histidine kinase